MLFAMIRSCKPPRCSLKDHAKIHNAQCQNPTLTATIFAKFVAAMSFLLLTAFDIAGAEKGIYDFRSSFSSVYL